MEEIIEPDIVVAARERRFGDVCKLCEEGADVNAKDRYDNTTLMYAVIKNNLGMVQYLIAQGADVNAKNHDGYTALTLALVDMKIIAAGYLIKKGATFDLDAKMKKLVILY